MFAIVAKGLVLEIIEIDEDDIKKEIALTQSNIILVPLQIFVIEFEI